MSLLSQQLKTIGEKNASLAVDRKSRQQIHSRSLLFDAKTAAAQDFDYIYLIATEGLDELMELDLRFEKFSATLFSETSIDFDRNVKSKDILDQVNRNLEAFMNLAAPYYNLAPTLKAMEWLVRRYHVNIHNTELLFLSTLSYHSQPVFTRIMNVVPKGSMPVIFSWLSGYKEQSKPLPASSVLKSFHNDPAFFRLYSEYLREQLKHKTIFKEQLVFYLSNTAQVLASHGRDTEKLNQDYIVTILETLNDLLAPQKHDFKFSSTLKEDIKLTAFAIVSVLSSVAPLSDELVYSLTISILKDSFAFTHLKRQTLVVLGQMWNYFNEDDVSKEAEAFKDLPSKALLQEEALLLTLIEENYHITKFIFFYVIDCLNHGNGDTVNLLQYLSVATNTLFFPILVKKLLDYLSQSSVSKEGRDGAVVIFEQLLCKNKDKLNEELKKHLKSIGDLEMVLMHTMGDTANDSSYEGDYEDAVADFEPAPSKTVSHLSVKAKSYFTVSSNAEFARVSEELLKELVKYEAKKQLPFLKAVTRELFKSNELQVSFLFRLAFTASIPLSYRLLALGCVKNVLQEVTSQNTNVSLYLLTPFILLGLNDTHKPLRELCIVIFQVIHEQSEKILSKGKKVKSTLFMESEIYHGNEDGKLSLISPSDANVMLNVLFDKSTPLDDVRFDATRFLSLLYDTLFKSTKTGKKFGSLLLKSFVYGQWVSPSLPLSFKHRIWRIIGSQNRDTKGFDDRFSFVADVKALFEKRDAWFHDAFTEGLNFVEDVEKTIAGMVGGQTTNEKKRAKEVEWFVRALNAEDDLQIIANERIKALFPQLKHTDLKVRLSKEFIELLVKDSDSVLHFDPLETLQSLEFTNQDMVALLNSVNIVTEVPEQSVAKRRRRSSSSTQKNMARDDINSMAAAHLRKLSIILDVLETQLRLSISSLAGPDLLQVLFKILTDLDYLGNDGKLPVLYAQETLASCMLLCIVKMKESQSRSRSRIDSNSIRADLIVNSIRLSQSPQVQNRLLLVIAELASLAPEIILHSVMPIFTFMGAHTVRQDDEFSSSALQKTISKVVPAITAASSSISTEIEFLLTSFVTAFQHIPRHRRVKLFVYLVQTLGHENSLQNILFLMGQQYSINLEKNRVHECNSLLDFTTALLKTFDADICLQSVNRFLGLWDLVPMANLGSDSDKIAALTNRPIFGSSIANATDAELTALRTNLLHFINQVLGTDEELSVSANLVSLRMKVSLVLFDDQTPEDEKKSILKVFSKVTSFILGSLDNFNSEKGNAKIVNELYNVLKSLLNLLPMSYYVSSISDSLKNVNDQLSATIAKNFAVLAGTKFENEMNLNSFDEEIETAVLSELLPTLVEGVEKFDNIELVQAYLDTFSIIVSKLAASSPEFASSEDAKFLVGTLKTITSQHGMLSEHTEIRVSSLNAVASVIKVFGVKCIGFFPKILPPALKIWESTIVQDEKDDENMDDEEQEGRMLLQGSVLMLFSVLVKRMPAFVTTNLKQIVKATLVSDLIDSGIRSNVLALIVEHVDKGQVLSCLFNLALTDDFYSINDAKELGLYLNGVKSAIDSIEKRTATGNSSLFMKWLIKSFEFRNEYGQEKFNDNTIHSIENSFHQCAIVYVMKLNDKSFRPLFANLVRWAATGEGSIGSVNTETSRLTAFFKFFNKLQDRLKSIITSYFSYMIDPTVAILNRFASGELKETNLRRIILNALVSSFKYDQDDYWSHQLRFETILNPLLSQLSNIEKPIGKYLVKAVTSFVTNVSSDEYNEKLVHGLIYYISNEHDNTLNTKMWTIRILKEIFQKLGEQWLPFLPTFIPYIAELLEDDDEDVETEVRKDLVRVIENVLGEPLERYLN